MGCCIDPNAAADSFKAGLTNVLKSLLSSVKDSPQLTNKSTN